MLLYLIAGEPSGDRLGAGLMAALKGLAPEVRFAGVGGPGMAAEGLESLFDYADLSVMGIAEVLPRARLLMRRIRQTAADCLERRPAALVTIDAPSFGLRVTERVRGRDPSIRTVHYVAPSVWAWRPGRARHMARFTDHVLALLPFEPPHMEAAGMTCDFVGHPAVERPAPDPDAVAAMRARLGPGPLLLVAPGSRRGELSRMAPLFADVLARLDVPGLSVVVPAGEAVADALPAALAGFRPAPEIVTGADRDVVAAAADAALVKSGTISLEMAAHATPHVSCYRTSWLTAAIVRRLVRIDTANLVNLVAEAPVVPEFLQERAVAQDIAQALAPLLSGSGSGSGSGAGTAQRVAFERVMAALGKGGEAPSLRAARSVLAHI